MIEILTVTIMISIFILFLLLAHKGDTTSKRTTENTKRLEETNKAVYEIKKELWKTQNEPEFAIGDKLKDFTYDSAISGICNYGNVVIVDKKVRNYKNGFNWLYSLYSSDSENKTGFTESELKSDDVHYSREEE